MNQELRQEAEILVERITVLREQEKRYTDLGSDIQKKKDELIKLDEENDRLIKDIEVKKTETLNQDRKKSIVLKDIRDATAELDKLRLTTEREAHVHDQQRKENETKIAHIDVKIEKTKKVLWEYQEKLKTAAGDYQKSIKATDDRMKKTEEEIAQNKTVITAQQETLATLQLKQEQLQRDYNELNTEYTKLLENYITTI